MFGRCHPVDHREPWWLHGTCIFPDFKTSKRHTAAFSMTKLCCGPTSLCECLQTEKDVLCRSLKCIIDFKAWSGLPTEEKQSRPWDILQRLCLTRTHLLFKKLSKIELMSNQCILCITYCAFLNNYVHPSAAYVFLIFQ